MEDRQPRNRRQFTAEFKRDAVELVRTTGRPIAEIARELGSATPLWPCLRSPQSSIISAPCQLCGGRLAHSMSGTFCRHLTNHCTKHLGPSIHRQVGRYARIPGYPALLAAAQLPLPGSVDIPRFC
jgi:hypothetical protein